MDFIKKIILIIVFSPIFNIAYSQGIWTQKADFSVGSRIYAIGFSIGNKGYIGTGIDSLGNNTNDFWEWDQAINVWTQKANFAGTSRNGAIGFSIGNKGYVGTGYDGIALPHGYVNDFWEYDPTANIWTQEADFGGTPREKGVGFSIGTKGYIGAGFDGVSLSNGCLNDFWQWDQATNVWTQKASFLGKARYLAIGFSIGNKGYIGTGTDNAGSFMRDFWQWDQSTNTWLQKADFGGTGRYGASGFSIGTKGYIGTGIDADPFQIYNSCKNDFWQWDQATNVWTQKAIFLGKARYLAVGMAIGNRGYIGVGEYDYITKYYQKDFWEFTPDGTGINEVGIDDLISIYPNPTSGIVNVQSSTYKIQCIDIYNINGEKIYSTTQAINIFPIDLSSQLSGIYFINITCKEGAIVKKIIINK